MVSIPPNLARRAFTGGCPTDKRWCLNLYSIDMQSLTGYCYVELTLNDMLKLKYANIDGDEIHFYRSKTLHTSKEKKELKTTENYLASFEKEERIKNAALLTNFVD